MKHLILMRHASAGPGEDDRARPLSPEGLAEAERMGRALEALAAHFEGVPADEQALIAGGNAARLYGLS